MPEITKVVIEIDKQLKNFQSASVDYVMDQFYEKKRNKVLIADEVGLGKTIIAKGVIAKSVNKERKDKPFHVVYICSNQVLAYQNISKLNPFGNSDNPLSRLIFLAFNPKPNTTLPLRLSSLTPNTSFNLTNSVGYKEERAIIFKLLSKYVDFKNQEQELRKLLQGNRQIGKESWNNLVDFYIRNDNIDLRPELAKSFKEKLEILPFSSTRFPRSYQFLGGKEYKSLYTALKALLRKFEITKNVDPLDFSYEIIRALRKELTQVCVKYLEADLFILDEFQKFKTLLDGENMSEAGEIAKAVLQNDEARVLLLSATPFKPYTTQREQLKGENHHEEFKKIVVFLGGTKGDELWQSFRKDQQAFFDILRFPKTAIDDPKNANIVKKNLEDSFKTFLSRNERLNVAKEYDNMISKNTKDQITVINHDISNFIAIDTLTSALSKKNSIISNRFGSTLEFAKSAPYPLSFLNGYNLYKHFKNYRNEAEIKSFLKKNENASISYEKIKDYKPFGFHKGEPTYPNGKLRILADECFKHNAEFLLWIPPCKPYYKPFGCYEKASDFSKILVFSNWVMAPRAITSLLSYEVERRTIGAEDIKNSKEKGNRTYFSQPRKPLPQITYSKSSSEKTIEADITNTLLTYPGKILTRNNCLKHLKTYSQTYTEIRNLQISIIKNLFISFQINKKYVSNQTEDDRWYWVASPLLDFLDSNAQSLINPIIQFHSGNKKKLFEYLNRTIVGIISGKIKMGKFPKDLFATLANITLSSPANACLFAFDNNFEDSKVEKHIYAHIVADSFSSLLNKPESVSAIKMSTKDSEYWKRVLNYSASGNITSMFDEYFYMLKNCNNTNNINSLKDLMVDVLTVSTSNISVDLQDKKANLKSYNMRCHFAANFGDENMNTESGSNRSVNVRTVFNSPFRPFVLASTSIGQEGLDFHFYCRKVFHWNLPHNAIDIEQREGRINRFKGFVIRKKICELISDFELEKHHNRGSIWETFFKCADEINNDDFSGIKPFWYLENINEKESNSTMIERFVPIHLYSRDQYKYEQLKATLGLYRLTFGQPRQEELVEAFKDSLLTDEEILTLRKTLLINLSPFIKI